LCWYGSDAEVFDFRPGRYTTEANVSTAGEWDKLEKFLINAAKNKNFNFIFPSEVLMTTSASAFNKISLESPEQPIPVKKQEKYNLTRWALTGRASLRKQYSLF
jgi:hypothetical protein